MTSRLFRSEAVDAQRQRLHGDVLVLLPPSFLMLGWLLTILVVAAILLLVFGSYARTESAPGYLVPSDRLVKVYAPRVGQITELYVAEGSCVAVGDVLAHIRVDQMTPLGATPEELAQRALDDQIATLEEQIVLEKNHAKGEEGRLRSALENLDAEIATLESQLMAQRDLTASYQSSYDDVHSLVQRGQVSKTDSEQRRQQLLAQQSSERQTAQNWVSTRARRDEVAHQLAQLPTATAQRVSEYEGRLAELEQRVAELEGRKAYVLDAPIAGTVTGLQGIEGRIANPQIPLLSLLPEDSTLEAELYVPSRAMGFVNEGQEVRLLYDAFPYQRFGSYRGTVTAVSGTIIAPNEAVVPFDLREPTYRVSVALNRLEVDAFGKSVRLQPGMMLQANFVLERRSFLDWLLEPLRAVGRRS